MILKHKPKKNRSRVQRKKQQQLRMYVSVLALTMLCICGVALMCVLNGEPCTSRYTYTKESDIWYVDGGEVQIAAPEAEEFEFVFITPRPVEISTPDPDAEIPEIFLPTPSPVPTPSPTPAVITITATGDCTLGSYKTRTGAWSNFKRAYEKLGNEYFFENFRELFSEDDLTIINLEGPLTKYSEKRPRRTFNFRGYPEYVGILTSASVEICNMANNHALDYKEEGFKDTYNNLKKAGIGASGYGPEYFTEVKGFTVGSVGYTEWNFEEDHILKKVKAAAQKCDLLIVSMHWNEEHKYKLSSYCRKMGRKLIDAGADIVIGNHSHVIGEIEQYKGKYIINSLGNFCFGGNDDPYVRECVVFRQKFIMNWDGTVEDGGIDLIPAKVSSHEKYNDFKPRIATVEEGRQIIYDIGALSGNMPAENIKWLQDGYVMRNGIIPGTTPLPAETAAEAALPQDIPMDVAR